MTDDQICVCDGRYDGCTHARRCGAAVADARWGPWCTECNPRRLAHISANLADIARGLTP